VIVCTIEYCFFCFRLSCAIPSKRQRKHYYKKRFPCKEFMLCVLAWLFRFVLQVQSLRIIRTFTFRWFSVYMDWWNPPHHRFAENLMYHSNMEILTLFCEGQISIIDCCLLCLFCNCWSKVASCTLCVVWQLKPAHTNTKWNHSLKEFPRSGYFSTSLGVMFCTSYFLTLFYQRATVHLMEF
jgi:hypothetical protein